MVPAGRMDKMKTLVTGSNGFIGSHLVELLLEKRFEVFCLVRKSSNLRWIKNLGVNMVYGDIREKYSLYKAVKGMDYIFHLAGVIDSDNWETYYQTNYLGTRNLVQVCAEVNQELKRFVYVSSISASGPSKKGILKKEEDKCNPINNYGRSKLLGEKVVKECLGKLPWVIIRPPNVLGTREKEIYNVLKILKLRLKPLLGNGDHQTSICFVKDLVRAILIAALNENAAGKTYFITDGKTYSWREIADTMAREMGIKFLIPIPYPILLSLALLMEALSLINRKTPAITVNRVVQMRKSYWIYDSSKANRELGFKSLIGFEDGIREIVNWYREKKMI